MDQIVITPAGLLEILAQIDELKGLDVGVTETLDGKLQVSVGSSDYIIDVDEASPVVIPTKALEQIDEINQDAYAELGESADTDLLAEPVTSGLLKEIVKTLAVGGLVRLAKHLLT